MSGLPRTYLAIISLVMSSKQILRQRSGCKNWAIRITDNTLANFRTSTDLITWLQSNPFGYALWFKLRCHWNDQTAFNEAIKPLPPQQKLPLQIIVQLLRRDIMFNGDEDKPNHHHDTGCQSMGSKQNVIQGLIDVIDTLENYIEERQSTRQD